MSKIKALGLAVVAVLTMSVVVASAANALEFKAAKYSVEIKAKGTNTHVFKIGTVSVECTTTEFGPSSANTGPSTELLISAKYSGCKAFTFANATINMKTCMFTFHTGTTLANGTIDIKCTTAGDKIQITSSLTSCEVQIGAQNGLSSVEYINKAGKVEVKAKVSKIKYEVTKTGTGCPGNNTEEAIYNGNAESEGFSENVLKEFTVVDAIEVS